MSAGSSRHFSRLDQPAVEALAGRLAASAPPTGILSLEGGLGAGKSTFARAFLRSLGVTGTVRSPTYTLVEPYDISHARGPRRVLHLDLYRLGDPDELDYLGVRDELDQALLLIEWLEQAGDSLSPDLRLSLSGEPSSPAYRDLTFRAVSPAGRHWLERLLD